jgi:hypothetical protein
MLRYSAWLITRDAKGYSLTVKLYPLALPFCSWLAARDAKGYSWTVRLYPLALHFYTWLATRDPKEYSCSTTILKASIRNLGSTRSFSSKLSETDTRDLHLSTSGRSASPLIVPVSYHVIEHLQPHSSSPRGQCTDHHSRNMICALLRYSPL